MNVRGKFRWGWTVGLGLGLTSAAAFAAAQPQNILPPATSMPPPAPTATATAATPAPGEQAPVDEPVLEWSVAQARQLLSVIQGIGADGLIPADYQPEALRAAILSGSGDALNQQASKSLSWLIEDMRDGRTRMDSRVQWFVVDTDLDNSPTSAVMEQALASGDIAGTIQGLAPTAPDYAALKAMLAATPKAERGKRNLIRVNMDRWRWLPRDLGKFYLMTNVPEFQLRLTVDNTIIRS